MLAVAHRGYSAAYPENTALAFERAIEAGVAYIETDVRFTRDGALACSHDPDLRRIAGDAHAIADLTLDALKAVTLAKGQSILTLEEVLALARGCAGVMLDVKVTTPEMAQAIAAALARTGMTAHVVYGARTVDHLLAVARCAPEISILAMPPKPDLAEDFLKHGVRALRYWEDEVTPERIALVRDAGCEIWVTAGLRPRQEAPGYTTAARAAALAECGVHALLVNDPAVVPAPGINPGAPRSQTR